MNKMKMKLDSSFPIDVAIHCDQVAVTLGDGRVITSPLSLYPWLAGAPPAKQYAFTLGRFSIDWPELGEGIDVHWLMQDVDSRVSQTDRAPKSA
jgi:hypothetical protein